MNNFIVSKKIYHIGEPVCFSGEQMDLNQWALACGLLPNIGFKRWLNFQNVCTVLHDTIIGPFRFKWFQFYTDQHIPFFDNNQADKDAFIEHYGLVLDVDFEYSTWEGLVSIHFLKNIIRPFLRIITTFDKYLLKGQTLPFSSSNDLSDFLASSKIPATSYVTRRIGSLRAIVMTENLKYE